MSEQLDDGGPAFPTIPLNSGYDHETTGPGTGSGTGITMLDYFAAHETSVPPQSWLESHYRGKDIESSGVMKREALVKWRYEMAQSMLAAKKYL